MKKVALIAAVVFTTLTLQSCRQSEEVFSPEETATLKRVQDSSIEQNINTSSLIIDQNTPTDSNLDGEIVPPPRK